jgi:AraC-like DNA-binding protein
MGYMMLGRITDKKNKVELVGTVMSRCRGYGTGAEVEEMIKRIKYRNEKQIQAAAKILDACCEYVKLREMVHPSGKRLIDSVERFVEEHISEEITVERLCEEFDISRTKLYETVRPYTNGGIAAFIKHKRLEYAKNLLKTTEMSIPQVADAAGFSDYNYFLRLFKQKYGISTKQMRKEE